MLGPMHHVKRQIAEKHHDHRAKHPKYFHAVTPIATMNAAANAQSASTNGRSFCTNVHNGSNEKDN
jgi:hypothetical protein